MADSIPSAQESVPGQIAPGSESPARASRFGQAAFIFIFITILLDFLALGIIAPVLPNLIIQFKGGNIANAASITGYFGFAWAAMQFIFSPVLGAWSDRFGRRPIILISCAGLGFDYILMAMAPTLSWLFVGRVISGITTSNISTAFAYVTDVTPPERRAKQFGMISAAFGLGFIIGPAVGGLLGNVHLRRPFWIAAGLSLANAIYGFFYFTGIAAAGAASKKSVAHGESSGRLDAFAFASGTWRAGYRYDALLFGAPGTAQHFRAVCRLPLWMERTHYRTFACSRGNMRKPRVRPACRSLCETLRRAVQLAVRFNIRVSGVYGICAGVAGMDGLRVNSFNRFVGHCRASHAIADVPASGSYFSGETAGRRQQSASYDGNDWPVAIYAGFCNRNFSACECACAGCAVLRGCVANARERFRGLHCGTACGARGRSANRCRTLIRVGVDTFSFDLSGSEGALRLGACGVYKKETSSSDVPCVLWPGARLPAC